MALSYANVLAEVLQYLQDSGAAIFVTADTQYGIENELKHLSRYSPQAIDVIYKIESRTGTATSGTSLTDTTKNQFVGGDATYEKVVHNTTDHTWAVVLANSSTSVNTLSADIMDSGDKYAIYNKRCRNKKQIYIGDMPPYLSIKLVEYPIGIPRNYTRVSNDVIELEVYDSTIRDSDSTLTNLSQTEVLIKFAVPHTLCQMTDLVGAVHTARDLSTLPVSAVIAYGFKLTETCEVGDTFYIANHRSLYTCTEAITWSDATNGNVLYFYPELEAPVLQNDVITFNKSSLTPEEENYLIRLVSARACISKSTLYYQQVNTAITQCTDAATAIGDVAALIALATTVTTGDIAKGRASTVLGATAVAALAAIIAKAETATTTVTAGSFVVGTIYTIVSVGTTNFTLIGASSSTVDVVFTATGVGTGDGTAVTSTGDIALGRAEVAKALDAILLANTEFDKIVAVTVGPTVLATSSLVSGLALVNTIPIGGGAAEYMGQAASQIGLAQGHALAGQTYLQEASVDLNTAAGDFRSASLELDTTGAKAREATANFSNATSHFNAATVDIRAAGEKVNEAISNLRLVGSRLQVAQGGLRFEEFGRRELAQVESELRSHAGYPTSKRYPRE